MVDINTLGSSVRENNVCVEKLCEVEASAKWLAENWRKTPVVRRLSWVAKYLKENELLDVLLNELKKTSYQSKMIKNAQLPHFSRIETTNDEIFLRMEKNRIEMKKQDLITNFFFENNAKPARLYGLANFSKKTRQCSRFYLFLAVLTTI